jgi:hypothetical protein
MTRFVYFDESGVGKLDADPHLIVAGAMVNADAQWLSLETYLSDMLESFVPKGQPKPSCFHAKDVYHGTKEFHRDRWPDTNRMGLLEEMAKVPKTFDMPLFGAAIPRAEYGNKWGASDLERDIGCYTLASIVSLMQVERYMRLKGDEGEVAAAYFENNNRLRSRLKEVHRSIRNPSTEVIELTGTSDCIPLSRITDTVSFQEKTDASILQVADYCAFAKKRKVGNQSNADWLYNPIQGNFCFLPHEELAELYQREPGRLAREG